MKQPDLFTVQVVPMPPIAVQARRSGLTRGHNLAPTLRDAYVTLLREQGPLTDHDAGALLGALSTTVGARRSELMDAQPGCIEACGRVPVAFKVGRSTSRTLWRWAL